MKKLITLLLLTAGFLLNAQIKGKITDKEGHGIPFVSVSVENTYNNTTANENGGYELPIKQPGKYTVVFQSIGFKTKKVTVNVQSLPHLQNVTLDDDNYELKEVVVNSGDNPANEIIRQAIAHKKENSEKLGRFEADFYSKGIFRVGNLPKKLMGMKIEGPEGLDKNGNGVIYLSETVSHLTFEQPNKLKERVIATKVSGNDNGFSYGTALTTFYNFYDDYVDFEVKMVSPLAKGAFGYYKYKFEGSTFDEQGHEINKIKIIPRRDKEPVFEGYIYIVSGSWAIYAVDVDIKGYRVQMPPLKSLKLQQNFSHNASNGLWAKNSQTFDFEAGMFGINFTGKFTHVYSNYVFNNKFDKNTFGREVVSYEKDAIKKDSTYWKANRPVPLTDEETKDYIYTPYSMKQSPAAIRAAVAAMFFMAGICFSSWASRIATIQQKLSISEGVFGAVLFAMPVGLMLSLPVSGWAVNRFGSRRVVCTALIGYAVALTGLGFMPSIYTLAANIMVFGFFSNAVNVSVNAQAVATEALFKKPIMASFHGVWSMAGFIGGGIGTVMIGQRIPPSMHFIIMAAVVVVSVFICWRHLNDDHTPATEKKKAFAKPDAALITLGVIAFCSMVVEGTMFDWTTIYFKKVIHATDANAGLGFTAGMCMMATGRFIADRFSARFGLKRTLQVSGALSLAGLLTVIVFPYLVPGIIGLMLIGSGISSVVPLVYSVAGRSTTMAPGPAIAAVSTISFLGFLIGPPVIGLLAEAFNLRISFAFVALMALFVILFSSRAKI